MNIYITKENEKWLRMQSGSMSGIINEFLDKARAGKMGSHVIARYDTLEEAQRSDLVLPDIKPMPTAQELPCCHKADPCKHWTFDGAGFAWVNSISGRLKEV